MNNLNLHLEQLATALPPVPRVNGVFVDPRQIAQAMRVLNDENWQYIRRMGADVLGCGDELRPLFKDARGRWYLAHKDCDHYGECDDTGTLILLRFAQDNKL